MTILCLVTFILVLIAIFMSAVTFVFGKINALNYARENKDIRNKMDQVNDVISVNTEAIVQMNKQIQLIEEKINELNTQMIAINTLLNK